MAGELLAAWAERERGSKSDRDKTPVGYRNSFRLARGLRAANVTPIQAFRMPAFAAACRRAGVLSDDLFGALDPAWQKVLVCQGDDALARAVKLADADARRFAVPDAPPSYTRVLAVAFHLTPAAPDRWAPFGSERLGELLGVHRNTVDSAVRKLELLGLLTVARDAEGRTLFSRKKKQARRVRYSGPQPPTR